MEGKVAGEWLSASLKRFHFMKDGHDEQVNEANKYLLHIMVPECRTK